MGTNYYFLIDIRTKKLLKHPERSRIKTYRHIGKRSFAGEGKLRFVFTRLSHKVLLQELGASQDKVAINEYGETFTAKEMLKIINESEIQCENNCEFS